MLHEPRRRGSWLIFDVGQRCGSNSMPTIGSEIAEVVARRSDMAGTVSSAFETSRAAGQSRRRSSAVASPAFSLRRSWLFRATHATPSNMLPEEIARGILNRSDARLSLLPTRQIPSLTALLLRLAPSPLAFAFPSRPTRRQSQRWDLSRRVPRNAFRSET
jgi:hypothetical protein